MEHLNQIINKVRSVLTNDLRKKRYRQLKNPVAGHCYIASEAVYHLLGPAKANYVPCWLKVGNDTHIYLKNRLTGAVVDPTKDQFPHTLDYTKGKPFGWMGPYGNKVPSKRTQVVLERVKCL